jgi:hypothetical protein
MDDKTRTEIEAAVFRRIVHHLRERKDVQNIDLMTLAGFCRNCFAKWYKAAAKDHAIDLTYDETREIVYGMAYDNWKSSHQTKASDEKMTGYKASLEKHGEAGEKWFDEVV